MKNNLIIGIDFSLLSPGICIIQNNKHTCISVYTVDAEEHHKLLSKEDGPFKILDESKTISINLRDKKDKQGITYSHTERNKLIASVEEVNALITEIKKHTDSFTGDIYVAMEGISFGSKGNTLIDICMATGILRDAIVSDLLKGQHDRFYVFSPGTIKKYALKGNAQKNELYDAIVSKPELEHIEFVKLLTMYKESWITPGGVVKKPLDDLVDATWIALLLKDVVENGFVAEEVKKVKVKKSPLKKSKKLKVL